MDAITPQSTMRRTGVGQGQPTPCRPARKIYLRCVLIGFGLGLVASPTYLICGGEYSWFAPQWATVLFFPGFVAGYQVHDRTDYSLTTAEVIGCLTVGLSYALLAAALAYIARLIHKRRTAPTKQ